MTPKLSGKITRIFHFRKMDSWIDAITSRNVLYSFRLIGVLIAGFHVK